LPLITDAINNYTDLYNNSDIKFVEEYIDTINSYMNDIRQFDNKMAVNFEEKNP
jgi:hypothetical protein